MREQIRCEARDVVMRYALRHVRCCLMLGDAARLRVTRCHDFYRHAAADAITATRVIAARR